MRPGWRHPPLPNQSLLTHALRALYSIAGVTLALHPAEADAPLSLPQAYHPFRAAESHSAHAEYHILNPDQPRLPSLHPQHLHWSSEVWRMGSLPGNRIGIEIHHALRNLWVPVADLAPDFTHGRIQPFAGRRADPSPYALNYPYDQAILTNLLNRSRVIVLHASAIILEGRGWVFGGRSGIGKTTLSRLLRDHLGATLLNDDRCALYHDHGQWSVTPTPWHGEEPEIQHQHAPLAGIVHLERSPQPGTYASLPPDLALPRLLATTIAPFYSQPDLTHTLDALDHLIQHIPSFTFSFHPDSRAIEPFNNLRQTLYNQPHPS